MVVFFLLNAKCIPTASKATKTTCYLLTMETVKSNKTKNAKITF